ncbi:diacylglycerol/lipid kinase family protein [Tautonia plasticadhaerens]|nr:diacylglycerol kinase family protein [Tautonia plasticadhaerens]
MAEDGAGPRPFDGPDGPRLVPPGDAGDPPAPPPDRAPWVGLVANPNSGIGAGRARVSRLVDALGSRGLGARVGWTPGDRAELVRRAGPDSSCRCLVAVGGDGTVAALLNERPRVPITVLPAGTENLFARHFGMTRQPERVAETVASGLALPLDLGEAGGRRFALMAGIGFDADVVTRHHLARLGRAHRVRPTSRVAYVEPVLRASFEYGFPMLRVRVEDPGPAEELLGAMAFVFNLPSYALGLPIAPTAREDDGLLDLVVFRDRGPFAALHYLWLVFRGLHLKRPGVWHRRVRGVRISSDGPVPVQLDGDPAGSIDPDAPDPWTSRVLPRAASVLVPETYARSLMAS